MAPWTAWGEQGHALSFTPYWPKRGNLEPNPIQPRCIDQWLWYNCDEGLKVSRGADTLRVPSPPLPQQPWEVSTAGPTTWLIRVEAGKGAQGPRHHLQTLWNTTPHPYPAGPPLSPQLAPTRTWIYISNFLEHPGTSEVTPCCHAPLTGHDQAALSSTMH